MDPRDLVLAIELDRAKKLADPFIDLRLSSVQCREMFRQVADEIEVYLRSGNRAGKSFAGAMLGVALARGMVRLDGRTIHEARDSEPWMLDLPRIQTPNLGLLLVPSYKQAQESVIATYLRVIGDWPHHVVRGAQGYIMEIRVKPNTSSSGDHNEWSKIQIYPKDGEIPAGTGANWIHADEPPSQEMWTEARARRIAGQPLYRWITATPLYREDWLWLRADYDKPADWRTEIVMAVYDNQALTPSEVSRLEAEFSQDPLRDARLRGDYVDLTGSNPFYHQMHHLKILEAQASDPIAEESVRIQSEVRTYEGLRVQDAFAEVYVWEKPKRGEKYYLPCDPSQGVADGDHDPCGGHVYSEGLTGPKKLVARYNGFCGGFGLGFLMAHLAERYNDGLVDVDMTGGYGGPVLTALGNYQSMKHRNGYPYVSHDIDPTKQGEWQIKHGFTMNAVNKAEMIESIRWALIHKPILIPSLATVKCLKEAVMDKAGRLAKPDGVHYEDLICLGRAAYRHYTVGQIERTPRRPKHEKPPTLSPQGRTLIRQPFSSMPWSRS